METLPKRNLVMDKEAIRRKMRRIALQVAEQNSEEQELVIAGINGNGEIVAKCLLDEIKKISGFHVVYIRIELNKKELSEVLLHPHADFDQKVVIIADDVANTGKTMLYALKPFLARNPKKIQTVVLVERSHKLFPIQTDYAGLSIATTLQEHIRVEAEGEVLTGAWLF